MDTKVEEKEVKLTDQSSGYVCNVCGDKANGYRLTKYSECSCLYMKLIYRFYGASSVCTSCRIFLRRLVTSKETFKCRIGSSACNFDKSTRNHCKY